MLRMKMVIGSALLVSFLTACGVNTSGNISVNANNFQYVQDQRTGLCFAVVASRRTARAETTGLGLTEVPCTDEVKELIR